MRILVTGGTGFVGGRVAQYLQRSGHRVVLGSRKQQRSPDWLSQGEVVQIAWADRRELERACCGIDVVVHAAGMSAQDCATDPVGALEFNGLATARMHAAAEAAGVRRFIYISTAHVYSATLAGDINEDTCPRNLHPYATSHLAGEHAVLLGGLDSKTNNVVLRLSNAFGMPADREANCWMLLVNDLCRQAVQARKLVLRTNGLQQRDFVGMSEVCRVVAHFASTIEQPSRSSVFNVGAGVSQSVRQMAQFIQQRCQRVLGFTPPLELPDAPANGQRDPLTFRPDRLKAAGVCINTDNTGEIDDLLRFCQASFPRL